MTWGNTRSPSISSCKQVLLTNSWVLVIAVGLAVSQVMSAILEMYAGMTSCTALGMLLFICWLVKVVLWLCSVIRDVKEALVKKLIVLYVLVNCRRRRAMV